jgi:hypothetical protein
MSVFIPACLLLTPERFRLSGNGVGAEGAKALAAALQGNTTLTVLE